MFVRGGEEGRKEEKEINGEREEGGREEERKNAGGKMKKMTEEEIECIWKELGD